jgi:hypothetical protein
MKCYRLYVGMGYIQVFELLFGMVGFVFDHFGTFVRVAIGTRVLRKYPIVKMVNFQPPSGCLISPG